MTRRATSPPSPEKILPEGEGVGDLAARYGCGPVKFTGAEDALYERRLVFDHVVDPKDAGPREQFEAVAAAIRDVLSQRWVRTQQEYDRANPKQVYYLSMEFLIGRSLANNITNLMLSPVVDAAARDRGLKLAELLEQEPDAGLGNGGLGRLAACFIESLATMGIPAVGYGLRYDYGIFRQEIRNGSQVEHPDHWLSRPDPWEVVRPNEMVEVPLGSKFESHGGMISVDRGQAMNLLGIPYDRPVVGYGGRTINTLRLWQAATPDVFDFGEFSGGDFFGAVADRVLAETVSRVLYPDDSTPRGRSLRFIQEYFLVSCSLADIVSRFLRRGNDWPALADKVAVQLNDTHPAMAVAELMRILLDRAKLGWDEAWDVTVRTLAYTNHTLLPEALEKWPVELFESLLPRQLEIIFEINRRFLDTVRAAHPDDEAKVSRMSLIEEAPARQVRMANLAIVGTHSTNGVAAIHSELLRTKTVADLAAMFPERFSNKTNGVTPRRWLLLANPDLAKLLTEVVGDGWVTDLSQLKQIVPHADDAAFLDDFLAAKRAAKVRFVDWIKARDGVALDPDSIFDTQIKRIHEYKRQLLNVLQIVVSYNRLRANPSLEVPPRTFLFAGKAAPAYHLAKLIVKLINDVGTVVNNDSNLRGKLRVEFLPNYSVTLAERLIPASDVSEQISTAGYEASGTSNMKFMMNGALTIGTRDGATIEIAEEAGEENLFLFGLTAEQVAGSRGWYDPRWHYEHEEETRRALDLIFSGHFNRGEAGLFDPIRDALLDQGDYYMHLADLTSYASAQSRVSELYADPKRWGRKAILNVARSGKFSSDRTIAEYAESIWGATPCPLD
ncbi:MAG: glycogen/starch/alpha-glucan phosphorylase [Paludisphaera borealis]|uniref:glycogen/starch/alpha-glucan phosphorylase n=1 Tax=Paludisphaera borealis TaxID=1387353 RepID=UPI002844C81F|nr:glycogen/starch/alpha-glucan phosphorylase [Paludisphaera borealis]MDR3622334.1 glycogen/starch/alpha-glucan phosphorylase [Paludisphaera borealis]